MSTLKDLIKAGFTTRQGQALLKLGTGTSVAIGYLALQVVEAASAGAGSFVDWSGATISEEGGEHGITLTADGLHIAAESYLALTVQASWASGGDETWRGVSLTDDISPTWGPTFVTPINASANRLVSGSGTYRFPAEDNLNMAALHDASAPLAVTWRLFIARLA